MTSKSRLLRVPWGQSVETGRMVYVDTVPNGNGSGCVCPHCGTGLIARHGKVRVHHFAHHADDQACAPESWLHDTAKHLLFQRIRDKEPITILWQCEKCVCKHSSSLFGDVRMEERLGDIRPDICLYRDGELKALLEVVCTHSPDPPVHHYAKTNGILLVQFHLTGPDDIDRVIMAPELEPEILYVDWCPCPPCEETEECPERLCAHGDEYHYCKRCDRCVEDMCGQFGGFGDHRHCRVCGDVMAWTKGDYETHYCCFFTKKHGMPLCDDRNVEHPLDALHEHCRRCGVRVTRRQDSTGSFFQTCYSCYLNAPIQTPIHQNQSNLTPSHRCDNHCASYLKAFGFYPPSHYRSQS